MSMLILYVLVLFEKFRHVIRKLSMALNNQNTVRQLLVKIKPRTTTEEYNIKFECDRQYIKPLNVTISEHMIRPSR